MNKQIEEMAKDLNEINALSIICDEDNCDFCKFDIESFKYFTCRELKVADRLTSLGYQKVDKDKQVVLTKEEYEEMKTERQNLVNKYNQADEAVDYWCEKFKKSRKETAREILNKILDFIRYETFRKGYELKKVESKVKELAKQCGVDLGEEQ